MKRSDFLKRLGIGIAAVVVAPKILSEILAPEEKKEVLWMDYEEYKYQQEFDAQKERFTGMGIRQQMEMSNILPYKRLTDKRMIKFLVQMDKNGADQFDRVIKNSVKFR
jgi:hypothetical protein